MKLPALLPRKKLRATAARRSLGLPDDVDYDFGGASEPNMKLSRALLIVLVLHVVAVAGIIAFNTIKPRASSSAPASATTQSARIENTAASASATPLAGKPKPTHSPEKIIAKVGPKNDEPKRVEKALPVSPPSKSYVVEKGDNPVKIAKKFHVPYDDLLAANHIDDPHKLKIGQKLIIPTKAPPKAKKANAE
ncbi:MAG: LysM peptidoglycan-binding domain-containing protein [Chthoniobacterales bacterium]